VRQRPAALVFVAGTTTEVGKTWWAAAVARGLRARRVRVAARKPVQSGSERPTDADVLASATGEDSEAVCPRHRRYELAWAPPMAAAELGNPPYSVHDLVAETTWPEGVGVGLVEGVGGPCSPVASDGDNVDLARALAPDLVVLVADAGLGTINAVRLCTAVFEPTPVVVALNRFGGDVLHERNRAFLAEHDGLDVITAPSQLADRLAE
jgi:dethiobiotin synthetase